MNKVLFDYPTESPIQALEALNIHRDVQMLAWLAARLVRVPAEQLECLEPRFSAISHDVDVVLREIETVKRARRGDVQ